MSAPQRNLTIADVLTLVKTFDLAKARGTFGTIFLGHEALARSFQSKSEKQQAYDVARFNKVIAKGDIHQKLLGASVLQLMSADYALLPRVSKWLREPSAGLTLEQFYHAWHGFMAVPFDRAEHFSALQRAKLDYHSRSIYRVLYDRARAAFAGVASTLSTTQGSEERARVAICLTQFLGRRHAPTAAALSMADTLVGMGHSVKILNQSLTPRRTASGFYCPAVAPKMTDLDTVSRIAIPSGHAQFWQSKIDSIDEDAFSGFCAELNSFAPTHLISLGPGNLYADVAGRCIPHIAMPTTSMISIGEPGAFATVKPVQQPQARLVSRLGIQPERIINIPSGFERPELGDPVARQEYGVEDGAYAVAVISNRMTLELSSLFLKKLELCLAENPRIKVIFFGAPSACSHALQQRIYDHRQMEFVGFSRDLFSSLKTFDAVLNPPRAGGGTSAAYAMAHGLNLFTVPDCDVATVAGPGFTFPDLDAVFSALAAASSDPKSQQRAHTKALARWEKLADREGPVQLLLDHARRAA
ncbi:MAG: hypothetical protein AAF221_04415 [Pseudomonadota bacterium]